jgi:hypothetical protein
MREEFWDKLIDYSRLVLTAVMEKRISQRMIYNELCGRWKLECVPEMSTKIHGRRRSLRRMSEMRRMWRDGRIRRMRRTRNM